MEELFVRKVYDGAPIFKEGDREPVMYHVNSGKVGIYYHYGKPDEKRLAVISADDPNPYFGEMGLVEPKARSATAVALEECRLGYINTDSLHFYLKKHPELVTEMLSRMSGRVRALTDNYMEACHVIAQQEQARAEKEEKKSDSEWMKVIKKYTAIFDADPTEEDVMALAIRPNYTDRFLYGKETTISKDDSVVLNAKKIPAGTVIFNEGDEERCMYELMQGSVGIYADYGLPTQKKLTTLSAGKERFFGEMGLIDSAPRSATAVAETECQLLPIDESNMNAYFVNDPDALLAAMRQMSGRIRDLTQKYMEAVKTIAENEKYEQSGSAKPEWLTKNLKVFADAWKNLTSAARS